MTAFVRDAEEISFSADGPYGKFDGLKDVDMFRKMAEAAPAAYLEVSVDGEDSHTQEEMQCCLKDGILQIDLIKNETDDDDRAYLDYSGKCHMNTLQIFMILHRTACRKTIMKILSMT